MRRNSARIVVWPDFSTIMSMYEFVDGICMKLKLNLRLIVEAITVVHEYQYQRDKVKGLRLIT